MYDGAATSVSTPGGDSDYFPVQVGLHQGSTLSPFLFTIVMDAVSGGIQGEVPWCLLFANDIALIDETKEGVGDRGFRLSRTKTEYVEFSMGEEEEGSGDLMLGDDTVQRKDVFKYLGSVMQSDGGVDEDIKHRIQVGWQKWRAAPGVLCDRKVPLKLKGKFYKGVVRPALLYGAECWATTKAHE